VQHVLYDNSALNWLFGQSPTLTGAKREAFVARVAGATSAAEVRTILNVPLIGEVAGLFFAREERFASVARFLYETCDGRLIKPPVDANGAMLRLAMERERRGRVPHEHVFYTRHDTKWQRRAFLEGGRAALDRVAGDATARKKRFVVEEGRRREDALAAIKKTGQPWDAEFRGWDTDPQAVVDEWTRYEMERNPKYYGLPRDRARWPKPREFVTLWYARAYHAARLKEIGEGRKFDDGGDLYDGAYFEDAAYADVFVTGDDAIERRARSVRITAPRVLRPEVWVAEVLAT
jgi:hypothetical protein